MGLLAVTQGGVEDLDARGRLVHLSWVIALVLFDGLNRE
jgi:hypothetical protein